MPQLPQRPLPLAEQKPESTPASVPQEEPHRRRIVPGRLRREARPLRRPPAHPAALPGQRQNDPPVAGRYPLRSHYPKAQRPLVRQHRLLETAHGTAPTRNPISGWCGRGHHSLGRGQWRRISQSRSSLSTGPDLQRQLAVSQPEGVWQGLEDSASGGNAHRLAGHREAGAGGKLSDVSTEPTAG